MTEETLFSREEAMDITMHSVREVIDFMHVIKNYNKLDEESQNRLQLLLDEHYCRCKDLYR